MKSSPLSLGVDTKPNENRLPIKKNKPDHHSNRQRDLHLPRRDRSAAFRGEGSSQQKICGHKKEKHMKFPVHSSRPALVYACALSLFPTLALAQHYQQTNLVSNVPVTPAASVTDPNLPNAWGLVHGPSHSLVDFKQRRRHVYALQHVRFKSRKSLGTNPASGTGAGDDCCAQRSWGHAGKWRQDSQRSKPARSRISHRGHVQRQHH